MRKNFEEVIFVMGIASMGIVTDCLSSVEWTPKTISDALSDSDLNVDAICTVSDGRILESVNFHCTVPFDANEVPGIIAPFYCSLHVEAAYDKKAERYSIRVGHGPRAMLSTADYKTVYDVDYLYNEFCKKSPKLDINEFINDSFNFKKLCKTFCVAEIKLNTGESVYEDDE